MACCRKRLRKTCRCSAVFSPSQSAPEMTRTAVVLMNLGGPDRLEAVQPFLFNLFSDPAILRLPALARLPLARIIAWRRSPVARDIYRKLGGGRPPRAHTPVPGRARATKFGGPDPGFFA